MLQKYGEFGAFLDFQVSKFRRVCMANESN